MIMLIPEHCTRVTVPEGGLVLTCDYGKRYGAAHPVAANAAQHRPMTPAELTPTRNLQLLPGD